MTPKLFNDLKWLKANNPLYTNIAINTDWVEEALCNDPDLFRGLIEQHDTTEECNDTQSERMGSEPTCSLQQDSVQSNMTTFITETQESGDHMDVDESTNLPCIDDEHAQMIRAFDSLRAKASQSGFTIHDVSANAW